MDIPAITPITAPPPAGASSSSDASPAGFAEALAAEMPDPHESANGREQGDAATAMPGDAAAITPPPARETTAQEAPAFSPGNNLPPPLAVISANAASPEGDAPLSGGPLAAVALPSGTSAGPASPGAAKSARAAQFDAMAAQADESDPASATSGAEAVHDALPLEIMPGTASPGPNTIGGTTASASAPMTPGLAWTPAATAAAHTPVPPQLDVALPLHHRDWAAEFSERVAFSVSRGLQTAELRVSPEELGPISVRISLDRNEASVTFVAVHPQVREVIEQALPQLRDSMQQAGLQLGEASVSGGEQRHAGQRGAQQSGTTPLIHSAAPEEQLPAAPARAVASRLLVDTYA